MATTTIRPGTTLNAFTQYGNAGATGAGGAYTTLHPNVQYSNLSQPSTQRQTNAPTQPSKRPAATAPPQQPAADPRGNPYDYSSDPILQAIRAGGLRTRADAEASAVADRKRLAIQLGDATGIVDDKNTADAAKANPFSSLAEIMRGYERSVADTNEQLNQSNLFYSGYRGTQLGRLLEDRQRQEAGARGAAQDQVTAINRSLAQALEQATMQDAQAQQDAKDRALQQALLYGYDPGAPASAAETPQSLASIAGTASPSMTIDPWLLAAMSGRRLQP